MFTFATMQEICYVIILILFLSINCKELKAIQKEVDIFSGSNLCSCDLTGDLCNINCCCDKDCQTEMLDLFSCPNSTELEADWTIHPLWSCANSNSYVSHILCIEKQNNPFLGYYFQNSSIAEDLPSLNEMILNKKKKSEPTPTTSIGKKTSFSIGNFTDYSGYIYGQIIDARTYHLNKLLIPRNIYSHSCESVHPLQYLRNIESSCMLNMKDHCSPLSGLDSRTFLITRIIGRNVSVSKNYIYVDEPCCSYKNNTICSKYALRCATKLLNSWNTTELKLVNNICENALIKVLYNFSWSSTAIKSIHMTMYLTNLSVTEDPLVEQQYSVLFHHLRNVTTVAEENKNKVTYQLFYQMGDVIHSLIDNNFTFRGYFSENESNSMTEGNLFMFKKGASGDCRIGSDPVQFGTDRLTMCRLRMPMEAAFDCDILRSEILSVLSSVLQADLVARGRRVDSARRDLHYLPVVRWAEGSPGAEAGSGSNGSEPEAEEPPSPWQPRCGGAVPRGVRFEVAYGLQGTLYTLLGVRRRYYYADAEFSSKNEYLMVSLFASVKFILITQEDYDLVYKIPKSQIPSVRQPGRDPWWSEVLYPFTLDDDGKDRVYHIGNCVVLVLLFAFPAALLLGCKRSRQTNAVR